MNRSYLNYILYSILVFIQVFFIDNFDFKIGLILFPLLINYFQNDLKQLVNNSFLLLILSDFFRNNFLGVSLIIFLFITYLTNQFSKIWSKDVILFINFVTVITLYNLFSFGLLTISYFGNLILIIIIMVLRRAIKSGYIRFN
jgi:hypothetical protein